MLFDDLFLGVGAMKAGTTWIEKNLRTHPDVYFCYQKELNYFAAKYVDGLEFSTSDQFRVDRITRMSNKVAKEIEPLRNYYTWAAQYLKSPETDEWYKSNFTLQKDQKYSADYSNLYALLPSKAWKHIKAITGNLKVIYTMRSPLDRIWSHIKFQLWIDGELEQIKKWNKDDYYQYGKREHIWRNTNYSKVVSTLKENLDDSQVSFYFSNQIKTNPEELLYNIENFLGIAHQQYSQDKLNKRINQSEKIEKPDFFDSLFSDELYKQVEDLPKLGIEIPEFWFNN